MTATLAIAALKTTLTSLANEDASATLQTIWTYPPEDPATGNFPALVIEVSPDTDAVLIPQTMQTPGKSDHTYPVNVFLFLGAPAASTVGELHARALLWPVPIYNAIQANLNLTANVAVVGDARNGDFKMLYRIGQIVWNNVPLFGLHIKLWFTEYIG